MKKVKTKISREGWRTNSKERRNYFVGEIGRVCEGSIITALMSTFMIFQGINLAAIAGVMLIVKVIDAFDDIIFGYLIDRLRITEWTAFKKITGEGKYLPWYRLTFFFFPLFTAFFFLMPTSFSTTGKLIWFAVFYLLYDFSYTLVEVPMNSMLVTLTDNLDERNYIIQTKAIINGAAIVPIYMIWTFLMSEYVGLPIKYIALGSSLIFFFMMLPLNHGVKEHNTVLANANEEETEHYSLKDMFHCIKTNKYLLVLLLSTVITACLATGGSVGLFAAYYHFGSSLILAIPLLIAFVPQIIAQAQTAKLVKRYGKIRVIVVTGLLGALGFLGIYFSVGSLSIVFALLVLQALPGNISNVAKSFLLPDTIEYTRYKTGKDCSGICFALSSFVTKLSTSVSSSLGLFILGLSNWINVEATSFADLQAQNIKQPQQALDVLWIVYALIPTIGVAIGVSVMIFYRLKDKDVELMARCNSGEITRQECEAQLSKIY